VIDDWIKHQTLIETSKISEGSLSIWRSSQNSDAAWDEFLLRSPMGQFQQSSMWAEVKAVDGWECLRVVATIDDQLAGGFQILWRQTRLGRIGYVSKGPVVVPEIQNLVDRLVVLMRDQSRDHKILALIVQPPDESHITSDVLARCGFIQSNPMGVIESTLVIDVSKGEDVVDKGMSKNTRRQIRFARKSGITIREGTVEDIGLFFNLMKATCKRQGTSPNPASVEALGQLWRTFSGHDRLRVFFAEYDHEVIAGLLNIVFGEKVSLWKKGWNFKGRNCYPNDLLYYETLHWACTHNFKQCDFAALDPNIADALLNGRQLSAAQQKTRDMFNIHFGGIPKLLPPARIWIANRFIRFCYNLVDRTGLLLLIKKIFR